MQDMRAKQKSTVVNPAKAVLITVSVIKAPTQSVFRLVRDSIISEKKAERISFQKKVFSSG